MKAGTTTDNTGCGGSLLMSHATSGRHGAGKDRRGINGTECGCSLRGWRLWVRCKTIERHAGVGQAISLTVESLERTLEATKLALTEAGEVCDIRVWRCRWNTMLQTGIPRMSRQTPHRCCPPTPAPPKHRDQRARRSIS